MKLPSDSPDSLFQHYLELTASFEKGTLPPQQWLQQLDGDHLSQLLIPSSLKESPAHKQPELQGSTGALGLVAGRLWITKDPKVVDARAGKDPRILVRPSIIAEDVSLLEQSAGVVTVQGGYSSHASVVARSLGIPSAIFDGLTIFQDRIQIQQKTFYEGDWVTLDCRNSQIARLWGEKLPLEVSEKRSQLLQRILDHLSALPLNFSILANADSAEEILRALQLGAEGVGLCRTENMLTKTERIDCFRHFLVTNRDKASLLETIRQFFINDLDEILEVLRDRPLTIRLLDAPLHEFLPSDTDASMRSWKSIAEAEPMLSFEEYISRMEELREKNPMMGHRGCRLAISYPEIYHTQTESIFWAAWKAAEKFGIRPTIKILIPFVMSSDEFRLLKEGASFEQNRYLGVFGALRSFCQQHQLVDPPFVLSVGAMIEIPSAALCASEIAQYADFFSFGSNDLTQMTLGISRDDFQRFQSHYSTADLLHTNPFQKLVDPVKILIKNATSQGTLIRPDLGLTLCGEQAGERESVEFCMQLGFQSISCSPGKIPAARLAALQYQSLQSKEN